MFANALAKAQARFEKAPSTADVCPNGEVHANGKQLEEAVFALG